MDRITLATVWLGGCSGCHMSFLDLDEWLFDLAAAADIVFSPIADVKDFPAHVDVTLAEGAIANDEHLHLIRRVRASTRLLIAFGDCAVTGNVTSMRNPLGAVAPILQQVYAPGPGQLERIPSEPGIVPVLLDKVVPIHAVVKVDAYLPGCPPPAPRIRAAIEQLLASGATQLAGRDMLKFG